MEAGAFDPHLASKFPLAGTCAAAIYWDDLPSLYAMVLLERERELDALVELCRDPRCGHGALLVVEGAPGLGKSALLGPPR